MGMSIVADLVCQTRDDGLRDGALMEQTEYGWACWVWKWRCSCGLSIGSAEGESPEHARALAEQGLADEMLTVPPWRHRENCAPPRREWQARATSPDTAPEGQEGT